MKSTSIAALALSLLVGCGRHTPTPQEIQESFRSSLRATPGWSEPVWQTCRPEASEYSVDVYHQGRYKVHLHYSRLLDTVGVTVDSLQEPRWVQIMSCDRSGACRLVEGRPQRMSDAEAAVVDPLAAAAAASFSRAVRRPADAP